MAAAAAAATAPTITMAAQGSSDAVAETTSPAPAPTPPASPAPASARPARAHKGKLARRNTAGFEKLQKARGKLNIMRILGGPEPTAGTVDQMSHDLQQPLNKSVDLYATDVGRWVRLLVLRACIGVSLAYVRRDTTPLSTELLLTPWQLRGKSTAGCSGKDLLD